VVPTHLPDDPAELKRIILTLAGHVADLEQELAALKRRSYGRRSERARGRKITGAGDDSKPSETQASTAPPPKPRRRSKHGRGKLPAHLPRISITSGEPGARSCGKCSRELGVIGSDVSERLEYIPGRFVVYLCTRTKRACPRCPGAGVITQPAPVFGLDRALPADGLLARIITDKFADHLPLTRQRKRFSREANIDIAVSTMCGWLRQSAGLLSHLVCTIADELRAGRFIQSDATGLPILEGSKNRPRRGHLWSYSDDTQVVFRASMDGKQIRPAEFLEGFSGTLLTDGAGAYNLVAAPDDVTRAGCWAHARRKFFEARDEAPEQAGLALAQIREIFVLEHSLKQMTPDHRSRARKQALEEPLRQFHSWLQAESATARPTSALGKAITYARNQWETLVVFLDNGEVPVHNNASERQLRSPVVGRKNWMFAGSEGGAHTAATCFSIVGSCVLAGIDPYEYLRDVLSLLPDATPEQRKTLTPKAWAARFGPSLPA